MSFPCKQIEFSLKQKWVFFNSQEEPFYVSQKDPELMVLW